MFVAVEFWGFAFVILILYNVTRGRGQNIVLLLASYAIYAYFEVRFVLLLMAATAFCFWVGQHLTPANSHRQRWFVAGIVANIGLLGLFKYFGFFVGSVQALTGQSGSAPAALNVILPLGLSF